MTSRTVRRVGLLGPALALCLSAACDSDVDGDPTDTDGVGSSTTGAGGGSTGETSPGGSGETSEGPNTGGPVDLDVNALCVEAGLGVVLPEAVVSKAEDNEFARTAVEARDDITAAVGEVAALPFPDASAVPAEVDDLTVFEGDVAYVWDDLLYVERGDGYSIYRYDGGLLPSEIVFVDQTADCGSVSVTQYGREGDGSGVPDGEAALFFAFNQAGTAKSFDWSRWDDARPDFSMREFEDGSGDFQRNLDDQVDINLQWNSLGEGTYAVYEDGAEVDGGIW